MADPVATIDAAAELPRVLIVDDSRIVRATIIKHVRGRYDCREEADGEAGWAALLLDPKILVVISDLSMPRLDGYGLLERIRGSTLSRLRDLPFVIISGDEDEASRQRAHQLGANDFITKGIGTAELLARLDSLVRLAGARQALDASRDLRIDDPDSGLRTRRYMLQQAAQALSHATRHGVSASALVVALDSLDQLRGSYGEANVSQLLARLGQMLATRIRREDSFGHFSPTAFAIVAPSTGEAAARELAARLHDAVAQANVGFQGRRVALTLSIGVVSSPSEAVGDAEAFVALAGQRMQAAADLGGNRTLGGDFGSDSAPPDGRAPTVDEALARLAAGDADRLRGTSATLALRVLPLLRLAADEHGLDFPLTEIEAILKARAQAEEDARPNVLAGSAGNS